MAERARGRHAVRLNRLPSSRRDRCGRSSTSLHRHVPARWREREGRQLVHFPIRVVTSNLPSKGIRWWFICPGKRADRPAPCLQRVGKLYLPSGGKIFACRDCYDLTYQSCRESRSGQAMWNSLGASVGMSGKRAKKLLDDKWSGERSQKERLCQRAVFFRDQEDSDVPSTPMKSVH